MKKFLRNLLLRNRWLVFEIILQESGFDISSNCYSKAAFTICKPAGQVKYLVHYRQFGSVSQKLVSLRSDKQMGNKLFTEFLNKKKPIKNNGSYGRLILLLWYKVKSLKAF